MPETELDPFSGLPVDHVSDAELQRRRGGRKRSTGAGYRVRKLECSACGFICRASAGAVERSGRPLCGCGAGELSIPLERDALAMDADARELAEADERERAELRASRRAAREANHGYATRACNCAVCGRFKARPADRCDTCGDEPAQYGATEFERRDAERVHNRAHGYAA